MSNIARIRMRWSGFQGAPGLSVFHFGGGTFTDPTQADCQQACGRVDAFAEAIKQFLPYGASLTVDADVDIIDEATGNLVRTTGVTPAATHTSSASAGTTYAGPVGMVIDWKTNDIRTLKRTRRLQGRTFLVPLVSSVFEANGTPNATNMGTINTAATNLRTLGTGPSLLVYGRPSSKGATDGKLGLVIGHKIPDIAAVMRSRRD